LVVQFKRIQYMYMYLRTDTANFSIIYYKGGAYNKFTWTMLSFLLKAKIK
jgi:hypothetical protein